jgi:hypothetical protein
MARARAADSMGDNVACKEALNLGGAKLPEVTRLVAVGDLRRRAVATAVAKCRQRRSDSRFYRMVNCVLPG